MMGSQNISVCFLCGHKGKTEPLQTMISDSKSNTPVFPWLRASAPAPGALGPTGFSGNVFACNLCAQLLICQWDMHEKMKTPLVQRQYWSKSWCSDMIFANSPNVSTAKPEAEISQSPRLSKTPSVKSESRNFSSKTCILCSKNINPADSKQFRLVNSSIIGKIVPEMSKLPSSELPVCSACFEAQNFQGALKSEAKHDSGNQIKTETTPNLASVTASQMNYEQAAVLYQLMLQQMTVLQAQKSPSTAANSMFGVDLLTGMGAAVKSESKAQLETPNRKRTSTEKPKRTPEKKATDDNGQNTGW